MQTTRQQMQAQISKTLGVLTDFSAPVEIARRVAFIKERLLASKQRTLVLGISGGVDSLTAGLLCQKAVNELNETLAEGEQPYIFMGVELPYGLQKDRDVSKECLLLIKCSAAVNFQIANPVCELEERLVAISTDLVSHYSSMAGYTDNVANPAFNDFVKGNIKARIRMVAQYSLANMFSGLVVGTDHAAEAVTGFFTKFGDGGCDLTPLSGLVKREVRALAKEMGAPAHLYNKVPTADLEELDVCKPDETALGVSYDHIDAFLKGEPVPDEAADIIIAWYLKTEHKRLLPYAPV